jgi:hypothetical protein
MPPCTMGPQQWLKRPSWPDPPSKRILAHRPSSSIPGCVRTYPKDLGVQLDLIPWSDEKEPPDPGSGSSSAPMWRRSLVPASSAAPKGMQLPRWPTPGLSSWHIVEPASLGILYPGRMGAISWPEKCSFGNPSFGGPYSGFTRNSCTPDARPPGGRAVICRKTGFVAALATGSNTSAGKEPLPIFAPMRPCAPWPPRSISAC